MSLFFAIKHIYLCPISAPLKLSAPTALMQNANTDATLVCHANKPYDECLWTTPYGKTYRFPDQNSSHEKGRIAYFGFADTDCGIIVRNVQSKDNGGWQCQLHSRNGGIFQNATDTVSLFAGKNKLSIRNFHYLFLWIILRNIYIYFKFHNSHNIRCRIVF